MPVIDRPRIAAAWRTAMGNNASQQGLLRRRSRNFRTPQHVTDDLTEAISYIQTTPAQDVDAAEWRTATSQVIRAWVEEPSGLTVAEKNQTRAAFRAKLVNGQSEQWLKDSCQKMKRRYIDDKEDTDPIEIEGEAATILLETSSTLTEPEIQEAHETLERWSDLTRE